MQHGQIFELKTTGPGGRRLWAYRYRLDGRGSRRIQHGGNANADDARAALQQALTATQRRKGRVRVTLGDLAEEYLAQHDGQPETTANLRWLLAKATLPSDRRRSPNSTRALATAAPDSRRRGPPDRGPTAARRRLPVARDRTDTILGRHVDGMLTQIPSEPAMP